MEISCKKINCVFNKSYHCTSNAITVGSDLDCKTFERDEDKLTLSHTSLFEIGNIEENFKEKENIEVGCKVKGCLFNKEGTCCANGISLLSSRRSAFFTTTIKK